MMNTFTLYAMLSPLSCALVAGCVAHSEKAGGWTVLLFTVAGLVLGGAAGAYSLEMEKWLIKSKRLKSSRWTLAYPVCSFLGATLLTGLLTFWLAGFTL
jgi:fructose-specific phosphotransferase system IIC component